MAIELVLYSRERCCLCDDVKAFLQSRGLDFSLVDIDSDPILRARYNDCVPVLWISGKERFRGRIDPVLLNRCLQENRE
jgi:glutaredoxin